MGSGLLSRGRRFESLRMLDARDGIMIRAFPNTLLRCCMGLALFTTEPFLVGASVAPLFLEGGELGWGARTL